MKLLAFLRDSYREAVSGWVLQVMLVLSTLLVVLLASVSFRPLTLEDELNRTTGVLNALLPTSPRFPDIGSPKLGIENYTQTNPIEPWKSDYGFDLVVTCPTAEDLEKYKDKGRPAQLPVSRATAERFVGSGFDYLDNVEVKVVETPAPPPGSPAQLRFRVASRGTKITDALAWRHEPSILFAYDLSLFSTSLREGVYFMEKWLVSGAGAWVALAVSVVITAGFVPNLLAKGAFDLIVAKPVSKPVALICKYLGGLLFILLLTTYTAVGAWLVIGLRTGLWTPNFLIIVPVLTFYFAILYAVSTLAAVLTRSTLVAILATALAWGLFWGAGKIYDGIANRRAAEAEISERLQLPKLPKPGEEADVATDDILRQLDPNAPLWGVIPKAAFPFFTALHAVTPRTYELDLRLGRVIAGGVLTDREMKTSGYAREPRETWAEMFLVSSGFIAVCLALASWRLVTRDG